MIELTSVHDVTCAKGIVSYGDVKMNIYAYLIDALLIDSGPASLLKDFIPFFEKEDIQQAAMTHYHEDHTGGARWLSENKHIPVFIHPMSIKTCSENAEYLPYRHQLWGDREGFQAKPLEAELHSENYSWEVLHTPGHSKDHMVFLNREKGMLFSGDLFVSPKTRLILKEESIPDIIQSIKHVLRYDFQEVFCGHAGYVRHGKKMFQKKLDYLETLNGDILYHCSKGLSEEEIHSLLFPKKYPLIEISEHEWDTKHIVSSVIRDRYETGSRKEKKRADIN
ncbi:MBL fold metallo-hydrolase [Peribacillus sp. B-H-3]|uniref:MBL fold metallo-hydrolase n=1 Tax=Peribacillus sp. B-H-3 TaxID=3400420 RepID=UPI003B0112A5